MNTGNDNNNHPLIKKEKEEKEEKEEQQQCINISCRLGEERAWVVLLRATMERLERELMAEGARELERSLQVTETRLQQKQQMEAAAEPAPRTRGQARALVATAEERVRVAAMTRRAMVRAWSLAFGLTEARVMPSAAIDIVSVEALADEDNYAFEPMCFTSVNRKARRVIECLDALRRRDNNAGAPLPQRDCLPLGLQIAPKLRDYLLGWPS